MEIKLHQNIFTWEDVYAFEDNDPEIPMDFSHSSSLWWKTALISEFESNSSCVLSNDKICIFLLNERSIIYIIAI